MEPKKSSEPQEVDIDTLRHLFNIGCRNFEVTQKTCLALTLMLQSREELGTMVRWMVKQEQLGNKPTRTEVVLIAEKIKNYYLSLLPNDENVDSEYTCH